MATLSSSEIPHLIGSGIPHYALPIVDGRQERALFTAIQTFSPRRNLSIDFPSDLNDVNTLMHPDSGMTLLGTACAYGNLDAVEHLLNIGASPFGRDKYWRLPIAFALTHMKVVHQLIKEAPSLTHSHDVARYFACGLSTNNRYASDIENSLECVLEKSPSFAIACLCAASELNLQLTLDASKLLAAKGPPIGSCITHSLETAFGVVQNPSFATAFNFPEGRFPDRLIPLLPEAFSKNPDCGEALCIYAPLSSFTSHSDTTRMVYNQLKKAARLPPFDIEPVLHLLSEDIADCLFAAKQQLPNAYMADITLHVGNNQISPHIDEGINLTKTYYGVGTHFFSPKEVQMRNSFYADVPEDVRGFHAPTNRSVVFRGNLVTPSNDTPYAPASVHSSPSNGRDERWRILLSIHFPSALTPFA